MIVIFSDNSVDPMTPYLEVNRVYMPDVWSAFDGIYESLKQTTSANDLENDNQFETVLNNDNLENNSQVIVTNDKNELISTQENGSCDEPQTTQTLVPEDSAALGVEPSSQSSTAMDLTQSEAIDSQPMDSASI